ncbi:Pantothenate synthetase [Aquicella siphonis]|uniref:Pantothenate synthetase n=1 Tax=Aquicella siphonis TaxID=254247 RepID=A0A5E4PIP8_9COXI|nr:pantoate--beta-alanine ligase [Aquicella siphonis]VVC76445.1 Pantothenate synthetase [Aquicella siphonis]
MNIVTEIRHWRSLRQQLHGRQTGLVHTMGNLHDGHLSLCRRSLKENDVTVAAIFINPTQFNRADDFELYPRTLDQDKIRLSEQGVDYLLLFNAEQLYPDHYQIQVSETEISRVLEGEFRPGHFTGMLTIVLKFLNLVQPTRSYYGEKDYQQLQLIRKMADALFLPVEIIGCETVRAHDGLALSSRNSRLTDEQRDRAKHFPALLQSGLDPEEIAAQLTRRGFKVDYIADQWQRRLGAVWLDQVRLIDNVIIK